MHPFLPVVLIQEDHDNALETTADCSGYTRFLCTKQHRRHGAAMQTSSPEVTKTEFMEENYNKGDDLGKDKREKREKKTAS